MGYLKKAMHATAAAALLSSAVPASAQDSSVMEKMQAFAYGAVEGHDALSQTRIAKTMMGHISRDVLKGNEAWRTVGHSWGVSARLTDDSAKRLADYTRPENLAGKSFDNAVSGVTSMWMTSVNAHVSQPHFDRLTGEIAQEVSSQVKFAATGEITAGMSYVSVTTIAQSYDELYGEGAWFSHLTETKLQKGGPGGSVTSPGAGRDSPTTHHLKALLNGIPDKQHVIQATMNETIQRINAKSAPKLDPALALKGGREVIAGINKREAANSIRDTRAVEAGHERLAFEPRALRAPRDPFDERRPAHDIPAGPTF